MATSEYIYIHLDDRHCALTGGLAREMDNCWMIADWIVGWLVGWLAGWLVGWLAGRSVRCCHLSVHALIRCPSPLTSAAVVPA